MKQGNEDGIASRRLERGVGRIVKVDKGRRKMNSCKGFKCW